VVVVVIGVSPFRESATEIPDPSPEIKPVIV
jgi:hypothetical protein